MALVCLYCEHPMAEPQYGDLAFCEVCGIFYKLAKDVGWFNYTCEIWEPVRVKGES